MPGEVQQPDGSWAQGPGSEHLEPVDSTADTRQVEHEFELGRPFRDGRGGFWASRTPIHRDGDERFTGWRFTLGRVRIEPLPPG